MRVIIIGAGPAGVSVVESLRAHDRNSEVVMFSSEPYPPYSPPAMADHFIHGTDAHLWRGKSWHEQYQVKFHAGKTISQVKTGRNEITTADGETFSYDQLVIASGSQLYAPLAGAHLPGIYNFKSLQAAEALVSKVRSGSAHTALVVGAGFIGMEIALLLRALGLSVVQIEMQNQVMPGMLDLDTAAIALRAMQERGVDVRLSTTGKSFIGNQSARGVLLENGKTLEADIIVAATGVKPNIDFLNGQVEAKWGIRVNEYLRTNIANIYAAGDVIESQDRVTGERYVHAIFPNAVEQGRVVGLNLAGLETVYVGAERMNSLKHIGLPVIAVGIKTGDEVMQLKRDGGLRTLYLQDNRLVGFQLVNDIRSAGIFRSLMLRQENISKFKDYMLDPNFGQGMIAWAALPV